MSEAFRAGTKEYYQAELQRLMDSALPKDVKDRVRAFLSHFENGEELSYNRLRFHAVNLRFWALGLMEINRKEKILKPSLEDVEAGLAYQKARNNQRGSGSLSEWSIEGYKASIKKFYKWLGFPNAVKDVKYKSKINRKQKPDYIISQEQVDLLIKACDNSRDKAIVSLLFDSGIRVGELLTLRIKDTEWDDYGMKITVSGKTGVRKVRVLGDSVSHMREWLNVHPYGLNSEAWMFCSIGANSLGKDKIGEMMSHSQIYAAFHKIRARAIRLGFPANTRINPHKFRHNMATKLAPKVSESILEKTMGWTLASKMTRVYLHLNDQAVDDAILEANGIKREKKIEEVRKPRLCMKCKSPNATLNKYCHQCGMPLEIDEAEKLVEQVDLLANTLKKSDLIDAKDKIRIERRSNDPDALIDQILDNLTELEGMGKLEKLRALLTVAKA